MKRCVLRDKLEQESRLGCSDTFFTAFHPEAKAAEAPIHPAFYTNRQFDTDPSGEAPEA